MSYINNKIKKNNQGELSTEELSSDEVLLDSWEVWTKLRFVLIDVTADWCVTCQFNKITTLNTNKVVDFLTKNQVTVIRADWTNKDKDIFKFINKYGRYGIPVNIVYGPNNKEGILLPEILSKDIVISKLKEVGIKWKLMNKIFSLKFLSIK